MSDLVPMRVRVYRRAQNMSRGRNAGEADWPPFAELPDAVRRGLEGMKVVDVHGSGWIAHDLAENLGTGHTYGQWLAMVPQDFAEAAHARWPHLVDVLTEAEVASFYDTRCNGREQATRVDADVVDAIYKLHQLEQAGLKPAPTAEELAERQDALNPATSTRGVRANPRKTWAGLKAASQWGERLRATPANARALKAPPEGWEPGKGR